MAEHLIETKVSPKELTFKPGTSPVSFNVTVFNNSDRFASFQLDVVAAGADPKHRSNWYTITPEVSSKKPPGDVTEFQVVINDIPVPGFVGLMNLEVRVSSIELAETDRLVLRLQVEEGTTINPVKLDLPLQRFLGSPGNLVEIPVRVYNPNQRPSSVTLTCLGLNPTWLTDGSERRFYLRPGEQAETSFFCQIPPGFEAVSKIYSLILEAKDASGIPVQVEVTLEVLPIGEVYFRGSPKRNFIPAKWGWLPHWKTKPVSYTLEFENNSNIYQQASVELEEDGRADCEVDILPDTVELSPGETTQLEVIAEAKRPWLGLTKKINLVLKGLLSDQRLGNPDPEQEILELHVRPIIPLWLQVGSGLLLLALLIVATMTPERHQAPVQSVSFNGVADWVVSGSIDHKVRRWRVRERRLRSSTILADTSKAVRVVRYRPVNNNVVAAGLENGQIQLWDLLSGQQENLVYQKDDRVFDLAFTQDSRYLFSGHGNDLVLQWDLEGEGGKPSPKPIAEKKLGFTVSDLALVGEKEEALLVGGRFNKLVLWRTGNPESENAVQEPFNYRPGGGNEYITSVSVASDRPEIVAIADNQGYISLWNLKGCLTEDTVDCQKLSEWSGSVNSQAVRSIALSADGCYLASAGDDKRLMLWPLTADGNVIPEVMNGKEIDRAGDKLNSVDIQVVRGKQGQEILLISGGDDNRVRFHRETKLPQSGCITTSQAGKD